jgi:N-acetylmuramoyl-L-alanine amidase/outer membrane protein OmpA-like peptidoglycan-associated protein
MSFPAARPAPQTFDVWHEVPLVPQLTGMSCWAAAAAMLVGWRECCDVRPDQVAAGFGRWDAYRLGLEPRDVEQLAGVFDLVIEPPRTYPVQTLRALLERVGPLWVGEAVPGLHVVVIAGLYGDGTLDGTWVRIADPWPIGRGERYRVSFRELAANLAAARDVVGATAQVLHAAGRRPRAHSISQHRTEGTNMTKHVIDPGHGPGPGRGRSSQYGARGPLLGTRECDVTYRIASRLVRYLGGSARLTRSEQDNPSLRERAALARSGGATSFLSLHANSGRAGQRGSEAYVHSRAGAGSLELARAVQRELGGLGVPAHGVQREDMAVLTPDELGADVAACLIEIDYLSDRDGEQRLNDERSIDEIARALARALGSARLGRPGRALRPLDEIPPPVFDPNDIGGWLRSLLAWTQRLAAFSAGISDASVFPHSSVCHLEMDWSDGLTYTGTGFYISPSRILTAAHNIADAHGGGNALSIRVRAGRTGAAQVNDVTVFDTRFFHQHPSYNGDFDFDMAVLEVPTGPQDGRFFAIEEQRSSPITGVIECGYAGDEQRSDIQHCDTGSIREVADEFYTFDIQDRHGSSGSPVFYLDGALEPIATGVGVAGWRTGGTRAGDSEVNIGSRLTDAKIEWIWSHGFSVYFDFDSATLRGDVNTNATLAQVVAHFNANAGRGIQIDGHSSAEGDNDRNEQLARERAQAVAAHLRSQGLGTRIVGTTGLGTTFGAGHAAVEYPGDRRVVIRPV